MQPPSTPARWAAVIAVPLALTLEAVAWYGMRMVLGVHLRSSGALELDAYASVVTTSTAVVVAGTLLAGLLAIVAGTWISAAVGLALLAAGLLGMAVVPPEAAVVPFVIASLGHGLARPALYGAAARALGGAREGLRNALFLLSWAGVNVGVIATSNPQSGALEPVARFFAASGAAGFAVLVVAAGGIVALVTRPREPAPKAAFRGAPLAVVAAVIVLALLPWAANSAAYSLMYSQPDPSVRPPFEELEALTTLQSIVTIGVALLGAAAFVVLHFVKVRVPALAVAGVGLVLTGASMALMSVGYDSGDPIAVFRAAMIVGAIGEVLFAPLLLSRIAGDMPFRLETAAIAIWLGLSHALSYGLAQVDEPTLLTPIVWAGAAGALLVGLAMAGAAFPLRRVLAPADAPERATP